MFRDRISAHAFFIRQIDRPLKERCFGSYFEKSVFYEECNNLVCTRNKTQGRQFGSAKFVSL